MEAIETVNYYQDWANDIAEQYSALFSGDTNTQNLFAEDCLYHVDDHDFQGVGEFHRLINRLKANVTNLNVSLLTVLGQKDKVQIQFRWVANNWHTDIVDGGRFSNLCCVVFKVQDGRVVEMWQQRADFLFVLGKRAQSKYFKYPQVVQAQCLLKQGNRISATNDIETLALRNLFITMNRSFFGQESVRKVSRVLHPDIIYENSGVQGTGVEGWKTFAYALKTAFGADAPTRTDEVYIREGKTLTVSMRMKFNSKSNAVLQCIDGICGYLQIEAKDEMIGRICTHKENYLPFLDCDYSAHNERLKELFCGIQAAVRQAE